MRRSRKVDRVLRRLLARKFLLPLGLLLFVSGAKLARRFDRHSARG